MRGPGPRVRFRSGRRRWFRQAAAQGNAKACYYLSRQLRSGSGVTQEAKEDADRWMRKAAELGYDGAQFDLGNRYVYGRELPKDPVEGVRLLRAAAD